MKQIKEPNLLPTKSPIQTIAATPTRAALRGPLSRARAKRIFQDSFIREVRVSYQPMTEPAFKVTRPEDVAQFVRKILLDNSREHLVALYLDGAHRITSYSIVAIGTADQAQAHPREIFQRAIGAGAVALVLAHNHPSDNTQPSPEDRAVTRRIKEAGELLCIRLLDHVIVTNTEHYSWSENGML